jgi:hypothetical protein
MNLPIGKVVEEVNDLLESLLARTYLRIHHTTGHDGACVAARVPWHRPGGVILSRCWHHALVAGCRFICWVLPDVFVYVFGTEVYEGHEVANRVGRCLQRKLLSKISQRKLLSVHSSD